MKTTFSESAPKPFLLVFLTSLAEFFITAPRVILRAAVSVAGYTFWTIALLLVCGLLATVFGGGLFILVQFLKWAWYY